jgi:predicted PurR-regulated permease PerM
MGRLIARASLRTLIHGFFMMFMLAVLLIIAYITGTFFLNQFKELSQQTVTDKMSRINESVQILLNQNYPNDLPEQVSGMLKQNVALLAKLQDIDINFYDLHGDLITSSSPASLKKD